LCSLPASGRGGGGAADVCRRVSVIRCGPDRRRRRPARLSRHFYGDGDYLYRLLAGRPGRGLLAGLSSAQPLWRRRILDGPDPGLNHRRHSADHSPAPGRPHSGGGMSAVIAVIGAGPAGLMAAERIAAAGYRVEVFDAMPSVARKFLLAGIGGMNITHSEDYPLFVQRYREASPHLQPMLDAFPPAALREWIHQLGIDTFVGSSGRVFPTDRKAAPLLRRWLQRLRQQGVVFHPRQRWIGWQQDEQGLCWQFRGPDGEHKQRFSAVVLALGGASWPKLGSDGRWVDVLQQAGVAVTPLQASNCGFELPWSDYLRERFAGTPVKHIRLSVTTADGRTESKTGEFVITGYGIEGSLVYALSAPLRQRWQQQPEQARLILDWLPHSSAEQISAKLQQ